LAIVADGASSYIQQDFDQFCGRFADRPRRSAELTIYTVATK